MPIQARPYLQQADATDALNTTRAALGSVKCIDGIGVGLRYKKSSEADSGGSEPSVNDRHWPHCEFRERPFFWSTTVSNGSLVASGIDQVPARSGCTAKSPRAAVQQ